MKFSIGFAFLLAAIPVLFAWQNDPKCGIKPPLSQNIARIVNGQDAEPHEFPWMVTVNIKGMEPSWEIHRCGGSILNKRWILTAAHCTRDSYHNQIPFAKFTVVAAAHNVTNPLEKSRIVRHIEKYITNFDGANLNDQDMALLKLDQDLPLDDPSTHIGPVCLPEPEPELDRLAGTTSTLTGWGQSFQIIHGEVEHLNTTGVSPILQKVNMTIWRNEDCATAFKWDLKYPNVTVRNICASLYENGGCHGDSGGPMVVYENGHWNQLGVVSWGNPGCGYPYQPSVFVRVSAFIDWIDKTISSN